jgi:hypothetical protein
MKNARYYLSYLAGFLLENNGEELDDSQLDKLDNAWEGLSQSEADFCSNLVADYTHGFYTLEQLREIIQSL